MKYFFSLVTTTKNKIQLIVIAVFGFILLPSGKPAFTPVKKTEQYYLVLLKELESKLSIFAVNTEQRSSKSILRQQFLSIRLAYKKIAVLSEYYNIYETKLLNGPALPRAEDDNPKNIIMPEGLQVMEEYLFGIHQKTEYRKLNEQTQKIRHIIKSFQNEPGLDYKFREELVFDALRSSLIRLVTLGITGFDSPVAAYSIPEASATLESFLTILSFYQPLLDKSVPGVFGRMKQLVTTSRNYLKSNNNFYTFDRLHFIKNLLSPLYSLLVESRIKTGLIAVNERRPLTSFSRSLFDTNTFDINFFSPNERFRPTPERIELGKQLFYNPVISGTAKRTCATCHQPEKAFTDGLKTALSVDEKSFLLRNTPTLWNSALQTKQFYDSRATKLENQLSDVVHNQEEMKGSLKVSVSRLKEDVYFTGLFGKAYPDEKEKITEYNIANAISSYIRSLISLNADFDLYMRGDESRLSASAKNGFNLFMGKGKCGTCHFMPLFNGLVPPEFTETESEVIGVPKMKNRSPSLLDDDRGKINYTQSDIHQYAFKTPTLRNIALTAPYMHNGVFETLEEVMDFYNKGGGRGLNIAPPNQTLPFEKLNLSKKEMNDIITFMKSLTDTALQKK